jgi:hypothetical protein
MKLSEPGGGCLKLNAAEVDPPSNFLAKVVWAVDDFALISLLGEGLRHRQWIAAQCFSAVGAIHTALFLAPLWLVNPSGGVAP